MITEQTSPFFNSVSTKSRLFNGKKVTTCCALIGATIFLLSVTATAAEVLPWKELSKETTLDFPLWKEASFNAFSLASAPELHKNKLYSSHPESLPNFSANSTCNGF